MDFCDAMERLAESCKAFLFDKLVDIIIDHGIAQSIAVSIAMRYLNMKDYESDSESD